MLIFCFEKTGVKPAPPDYPKKGVQI